MALSTREAYGQALEALGHKYPFIVLDADLSKATKTDIFAGSFPKRFFNIGIAECDMMSTAAGIASCGNTVFTSTFAIFAAGRAYEQIRNSIAYTGLNVKVAATHGGVLIGEDGGSHQAIEDIALMRVLPGMTVLVPCDEVSTEMLVELAINTDGPVYLRFGRFPSPPVYGDKGISFTQGGANVVGEGEDVAIFAVGDMVAAAMQARAALLEEDISAAVIDLYCVKPLNEGLIAQWATHTKAVVTAEDHSVIGGIGSAVAEVIAENGGTKLIRVGIRDTFGRSGKPLDLARHFGLTSAHIAAACRDALTGR